MGAYEELETVSQAAVFYATSAVAIAIEFGKGRASAPQQNSPADEREAIACDPKRLADAIKAYEALPPQQQQEVMQRMQEQELRAGGLSPSARDAANEPGSRLPVAPPPTREEVAMEQVRQEKQDQQQRLQDEQAAEQRPDKRPRRTPRDFASRPAPKSPAR